jgi:hypothetical protein
MKFTTAVAVLAMTFCSSIALADERPYTDGSVWQISMIRTTDGMFDPYMESLGKTYKPIMDEAKKQGLVLSYKVIGVSAMGPDDFNVLLLVEYKNWAALDGLAEKFEPIARKSMSKEQEDRLMEDRISVRRFVGDKTGQEVLLK